MYIPPPGVLFRIYNKNSGKVIYSSLKTKPEVSHTDRKDVKDDQWFYLIHGTGNRAGKYVIKGKESNQVIFSRRHAEPNVGHTGGNGDYDDNWHTFEPGQGEHVGYFRILTPSPGNTVLVSRNHAAPYFCNYENNIVKYEDQHFQFELEDVEFSSVEWNFQAAKIVSTERKPAGDVAIRNNTDNEQEYTVNLTIHHDIEGKAERLGGFPLQKSDVKLKTPLPTIKDASIAAHDEDVEWTFGSQFSNSTLETTEKKFIVDAKMTGHVYATVASSKYEAPFVVKFKGKRSGKEVTVNGIWRGQVSGADLQYEVKKQPA